MSVCSAACRAPSSTGICSSPSSSAGSGENQIASVSKVVSGISIGTTSMVEPSRTDLRAYATTCSVTETRPKWRSTPSRRSTRSASSIVVSVSFFTCVYQSTAAGRTSATWPMWSSSSTRYCSPRWR